MFIALLITATLAFLFCCRQIIGQPLSLPVPTGNVSNLHIIDTTDDVPIYVTPTNAHPRYNGTLPSYHDKENILTTTITDKHTHTPWDGWNDHLDGDRPIGFVSICSGCRLNIVWQDGNVWTEHGTTPTQRHLDQMDREAMLDWYDPKNTNGFWNEG